MARGLWLEQIHSTPLQPMFRKIAYTSMIATVIFSWGMMLNIAYSEDRAAAFDNREALVAQGLEKNGRELAKPAPAVRLTRSSAVTAQTLPQVKPRRPKSLLQPN